MSVQRCQAETTSTEFVKWQRYQRQEMNIHSKLDYYLAQIAAETRRTISKNPEKLGVEDLFIKFETAREKKPSLQEKKEQAQQNKSAWMALAALWRKGVSK